MNGETRDQLASLLTDRLCPLCAGRLSVDKPKWGWGSQGSRAKCSNCGLQLRLPWVPLQKAVLRLAKARRTVRS